MYRVFTAGRVGDGQRGRDLRNFVGTHPTSPSVGARFGGDEYASVDLTIAYLRFEGQLGGLNGRIQ